MVSDLFGLRAAGYLRALKQVYLSSNAIPGQLTLHTELQKQVPPAWLDRLRCTLVHDAGSPVGHFVLRWQEVKPVQATAILDPQDKTNVLDFIGPDPFWIPVTWIALIDSHLIVLHRNPTTQAIPTLKPPDNESLNWPPPSAG